MCYKLNPELFEIPIFLFILKSRKWWIFKLFIVYLRMYDTCINLFCNITKKHLKSNGIILILPFMRDPSICEREHVTCYRGKGTQMKTTWYRNMKMSHLNSLRCSKHMLSGNAWVAVVAFIFRWSTHTRSLVMEEAPRPTGSESTLRPTTEADRPP